MTNANDIGNTLRTIWEEALGIDGIAPTEDLFQDLGASSIHALKAAALIKDRIGVYIAPEALLRAPTIQQLTAVLGSQTRLPETPVVPLRPSIEGGRPPLFLFHAASGSVFPYRLLAGHISDRAVYGVQDARTFASHVRETSLAALVEQYSAHIARVQPEGPYMLAGHSFGGALAFEFATRLPQAIQKRTTVLMLDTYPVAPWQGRLLDAARAGFTCSDYLPFLRKLLVQQFKRRTHLWPVVLLGLSRNTRELAEAATWVLAERIGTTSTWSPDDESRALQTLYDFVTEELPELFEPGLTSRAMFNRARVLVQNYRAFHRYQPKRRFYGRLAVVQPAGANHSSFWARHVAGSIESYRCEMAPVGDVTRGHAVLLSDRRSLATVLPAIRRELSLWDAHESSASQKAVTLSVVS